MRRALTMTLTVCCAPQVSSDDNTKLQPPTLTLLGVGRTWTYLQKDQPGQDSNLMPASDPVILAHMLKEKYEDACLPSTMLSRWTSTRMRKEAGIVYHEHWKFSPEPRGIREKPYRLKKPETSRRVPQVCIDDIASNPIKAENLTSPVLGPALPGPKAFQDTQPRVEYPRQASPLVRDYRGHLCSPRTAHDRQEALYARGLLLETAEAQAAAAAPSRRDSNAMRRASRQPAQEGDKGGQASEEGEQRRGSSTIPIGRHPRHQMYPPSHVKVIDRGRDYLDHATKKPAVLKFKPGQGPRPDNRIPNSNNLPLSDVLNQMHETGCVRHIPDINWPPLKPGQSDKEAGQALYKDSRVPSFKGYWYRSNPGGLPLAVPQVRQELATELFDPKETESWQAAMERKEPFQRTYSEHMHGTITCFPEVEPPPPPPDDSEEQRLARIAFRRRSMFEDLAKAREDVFAHTQQQLRLEKESEFIEMDGETFRVPTDVLEHEFGLEDSSEEEGDGNYSSSEDEGALPDDEKLWGEVRDLEKGLAARDGEVHPYAQKLALNKFVHKQTKQSGSSSIHRIERVGAEECKRAALMYPSSHVAGVASIRPPPLAQAKDAKPPDLPDLPYQSHDSTYNNVHWLGAEVSAEERKAMQGAVANMATEFAEEEENGQDKSRQGRRPYVKQCEQLNINALPIVRSQCRRDRHEKHGRLAYKGYGMGHRITLAVAAGLKVSRMPLIELDLGGNNVNPISGKELLVSLWSNQECGHYLQELSLRGNELGHGQRDIVKGVTKNLEQLLIKAREMQVLDLSANQLSDEALVDIFASMDKCQQIAPDNRPPTPPPTKGKGSMKGGKKKSEPPKEPPKEPQSVGAKIVAVRLSGNKMGGPKRYKLAKGGGSKAAESACKKAATFIKNSTTLTELDLSANRLARKGSRDLCTAISASASLMDINLSFNQLGDRPCGILAKALQKCSTIKRLDLTACYISYIGAEMLVAQAMGTPGLEKLVLDENAIGQRGGRAVMRALVRGVGDLDHRRDKISIDGCDVNVDQAANGVRSLIDGPDRSGIKVDKPYPFISEETGEKCVWIPSNPCGAYTFSLSDPCQRAQAQLACDHAATMKTKSTVKLNGKSLKLTGEEAPVCYIQLPFTGKLRLEIKELAPFPTEATAGDACLTPSELESVVCGLGAVRHHQVEMDVGDTQRQALLKICMAEFYITPDQVVPLLSKFDAGDNKVAAAVVVYPRVVGKREDVLAAMEDCVGPTRMTQLEYGVGQLWHFCEANPCAHYIIDCSHHGDCSLLHRLMQWAAAERKAREKANKGGMGRGPPDPSQWETGEAFRNATWRPFNQSAVKQLILQSREECLILPEPDTGKKKKKASKKAGPEEAGPPKKEWQLGLECEIIPSGIPNNGVLEFDFVPFGRAPVDSQPVGKEGLQRMVQAAKEAASRAIAAYKDDKANRDTGPPRRGDRDEYEILKAIDMKTTLATMRSLLGDSYVTVSQVLSLFELAGPQKELLVDILMLCWNRITDTDNMHHVRLELTPPPPEVNDEPLTLQTMLRQSEAKIEESKTPPDEWTRARSRIGCLNLFNPMHPEGPHYLDVSKNDDRQVALALIQLGSKEVGPKGTKDTLTEFVFTPVKGKKITKLLETWPAEMPKAGKWELVYKTEEEYRNKEFPDGTAWVDWKLRMKVCEELKNWKKFRKIPLKPGEKRPKADKDGPPPYHLASYRAAKELLANVAEMEAQKAQERAEQMAAQELDDEMRAKMILEASARQHEALRQTDITMIDHSL